MLTKKRSKETQLSCRSGLPTGKLGKWKAWADFRRTGYPKLIPVKRK